MNYIMYIAMAIIVLCWVLTPFLRKIVLKKVSSFDFLLLTHSIVMLFILLAILVMKIKNKKNFKFDFSSMDKKDILVLILASVGTFVSSLLLIWLLKYKDSLDENSRNQLKSNPLRILDSKNPDLSVLIANAPQVAECMDEESKKHFSQLQIYLDMH